MQELIGVCYTFFMDKIYYFGYGTTRIKEVVKGVIEGELAGGYGCVLDGYILCYQTLRQIPEIPRKVLEEVWGKNFKCYSIIKGSGVISGTIWQITLEDFEKIKKWEFVPEWKEELTVKVKTYNGEIIEAHTTKVHESQDIFTVVDGINYESNLNPQGKKKDLTDLEVEEQYKIKTLEKIRENLELTQRLTELKTKA